MTIQSAFVGETEAPISFLRAIQSRLWRIAGVRSFDATVKKEIKWHTHLCILLVKVFICFLSRSSPVNILSTCALFFLPKGECRLRVNQQHGIYDNGKALPQFYRERVLDLHHQGFSQRQIAQDMRVSVGYVNKVVQLYEHSNSSLAAPRNRPVRNKFTRDVIEYVECEKLCKPSVYASEIQQRLLLDGISPPGYVPSQSGIKN